MLNHKFEMANNFDPNVLCQSLEENIGNRVRQCSDLRNTVREQCARPPRTPEQILRSKVNRVNHLTRVCPKFIDANPGNYVLQVDNLNVDLFNQFYTSLWNRNVMEQGFGQEYQLMYPPYGVEEADEYEALIVQNGELPPPPLQPDVLPAFPLPPQNGDFGDIQPLDDVVVLNEEDMRMINSYLASGDAEIFNL